MIIRTSQDLDLVTNCACSCAYPTCAEPRKECESMTAEADASQTDYDLALEEWTAARDAWVALDPENNNPEDFETPAPEEPADYADWQYGTWGPFAPPTGEPEDDLPTIYRKQKETTVYQGSEGEYQTGIGPDAPVDGGALADPGRSWGRSTASWTPGAPEEDQVRYYDSGFGLWWDDGNGDSGCNGATADQVTFPASFPAIDHSPNEWVAENNPCEVTATQFTPANSRYGMSNTDGTYGTEVGVQGGCPESWQREEDGVTWAEGLKYTEGAQLLDDGITKTQLIENATGKLPEEWPTPAQGNDCESTIETTWPTIGELPSGDPGSWPDCEGTLPVAAGATATVTKARYRFGVPEGYSTEEAPRSTWEMQWDEAFFPEGFDNQIDDPDYEPPAEEPEGGFPPVPQIPDPDAPLPAIIEQRSWAWGGSMEDPWSEWFTLKPQESPGVVKVVNVMITCWKSAKVGNKPTAWGEVFEFEEPEVNFSQERKSFNLAAL